MTHPTSCEDFEWSPWVDCAVLEVDDGMTRLTLYINDGTMVVIEEDDEAE